MGSVRGPGSSGPPASQQNTAPDCLSRIRMAGCSGVKVALTSCRWYEPRRPEIFRVQPAALPPLHQWTLEYWISENQWGQRWESRVDLSCRKPLSISSRWTTWPQGGGIQDRTLPGVTSTESDSSPHLSSLKFRSHRSTQAASRGYSNFRLPMCPETAGMHGEQRQRWMLETCLPMGVEPNWSPDGTAVWVP